MTIHTVKAGETFASIAAVYGIPLSYLLRINGLQPQSVAVVGQALLILFPAAYYTVQSGDTASAVAQQAGISVTRLLQLNPEASRPLYTGQVLANSSKYSKQLYLGNGRK